MPSSFAHALARCLDRWPADFALGSVAIRNAPELNDHTELRVTGDGRATLDLTRAAYDQPMPVGRFAGQVDPALVRQLAETLSRIDFTQLRGQTPAGGDPHLVEVVADGRAHTFPLDALFPLGQPGAFVRGALAQLVTQLLAQPAAALRLGLTLAGDRFRLEFQRLGDAPLLVGNPLVSAPGEAFCKLQVLQPVTAARNFVWDSFDVPLARTAFDGAGRRFLLPPRLAIDFADPTAGRAFSAPAVRVLFGDAARPPGLCVGGLDVFARVVSSNVVEPGAGR